MAVQWLTADEQRAWRAYVRAGTLLTARLNRQLQADSGLSLPEYEVLVQLSEATDGQLRPFQLGLALDWEQSRLSHLLARMMRRGFVIRQDCPGDRRGALVMLTRPAGPRSSPRRPGTWRPSGGCSSTRWTARRPRRSGRRSRRSWPH